MNLPSARRREGHTGPQESSGYNCSKVNDLDEGNNNEGVTGERYNGMQIFRASFLWLINSKSGIFMDETVLTMA